MSGELTTLPPPLPPPSPYPEVDPHHEHLRDELFRVWLRVEYQIRRRWELGTVPRVADDASIGIWTPENIAGMFRAAHAQHAGLLRVPDEQDAGSAALLEAYLRHSALVDDRVAASLAAGRRLPLLEIAQRFRLTRHQQAALTYALMPEVDPELIPAYRYLSHDPGCRGLDPRLLALLVYDTPESRALMSRDLSPTSPLLHFRLLEHDDGTRDALYRRLRPSPRLVQLLSGDEVELDPQLCDVAELRVGLEEGLGIFPEAILHRAQAALRGSDVLLVLQGPRGAGKRLLGQMAAAASGRRLLVIQGRPLLSYSPDALRQIVRGLLREAILLDAVLLIPEVDDLMVALGERDDLPAPVALLCHEHRGPVILTIAGDRMPRLDLRPLLHINVEVPSLTDRATLWQQQVPTLSGEDAAALAERFAAPGGIIAMAARAALASRLPGDGPADVAALDLAVRSQLHDRISRMGRRLPTPYAFEDLIVDSDVSDTLGEIVSAVRKRRQVRERWGFRGAPGVSVLFSGDPGVGKTMSATVLARQLGLAVYEIDLARVVSKWIGETEKNLAEVFDAAEPGHVVLLFNEADSLFGKRTSEVKSANDRYANLETNYLLQRLERFGGLAILTTNLGKSIDPAFRRRFAYDVQFSFPTAEMRTELWLRALPKAALEPGLNFVALAERYQLSGGFIKVAAERAAFVAAAQDGPITLLNLNLTIERMYRERGKLTTVGKLE